MEITVFRPIQCNDKFRDYKLIVDNKVVASLKRGETKVILLPEDANTIKAKIDWCTSPSFPVSSITSGKITVKNSFSDNVFKFLFLPLYYISFGRGKYLTIENGL